MKSGTTTINNYHNKQLTIEKEKKEKEELSKRLTSKIEPLVIHDI